MGGGDHAQVQQPIPNNCPFPPDPGNIRPIPDEAPPHHSSCDWNPILHPRPWFDQKEGVPYWYWPIGPGVDNPWYNLDCNERCLALLDVARLLCMTCSRGVLGIRNRRNSCLKEVIEIHVKCESACDGGDSDKQCVQPVDWAWLAMCHALKACRATTDCTALMGQPMPWPTGPQGPPSTMPVNPTWDPNNNDWIF